MCSSWYNPGTKTIHFFALQKPPFICRLVRTVSLSAQNVVNESAVKVIALMHDLLTIAKWKWRERDVKRELYLSIAIHFDVFPLHQKACLLPVERFGIGPLETHGVYCPYGSDCVAAAASRKLLYCLSLESPLLLLLLQSFFPLERTKRRTRHTHRELEALLEAAGRIGSNQFFVVSKAIHWERKKLPSFSLFTPRSDLIHKLVSRISGGYSLSLWPQQHRF